MFLKPNNDRSKSWSHLIIDQIVGSLLEPYN